MRQRRDPHLESNARKAAEGIVYIKYLLRNRFGVANQQRTRGSAQSVKLRPGSWGPAAFFTDLGERVGISRVEIVCSLLGRVSQKADCVKAYDEFLGGVAGAPPRFAIKLDERPKSLWFAANDGDHQRESERAGANERCGSSTDPDPNGQRILQRTGVDHLPGERWTVFTSPVHVGVLPNLEEEVQFFCEKRVVVV